METLSLPPIRRNGFETTNGNYPNDVLRQQVSGWIKYALQTRHDPPLSHPLTIHLNALLDAPIPQESLVAVSFETFRVLIEQLEALGIPESIMPALHIPLEMSDLLDARPYTANALIEQIYHTEPPSFYLVERAFQTKMNDFERYEFPLRAADFMADAEGISVKYYTWRTLEDIENGWEYGRSIEAEYYPSAYRYQR